MVYLGYDEHGKKQYKWFSGFNTKKEAEAFLASKLQEVNTGTFVDPEKQPLADYMRQWLEDKAGQLRPGTIRSYRWLVNTHIIPGLGRIDLAKLRPNHLQKFYTDMRKKGLSNRTIRYAHTLLHEALERAVHWGLIARNVADVVDAPRANSPPGKTWTIDEAFRFLKVAKEVEPRYWIAFFLALMTGMRRGEIIALRWQDVDLENGRLHVRHTLTWAAGRPLFQEPKTDRSRRSIAVAPEVIATLRAHRAKQAEERLLMGEAYHDQDLVLARVNGDPLHPRTINDAWYRALSKADVPRIRFHDLRHTHASLLLQQGVHPKIVSERLGHSTINITLDIYSHVLPDLQQQVAREFSESFFRGRKL